MSMEDCYSFAQFTLLPLLFFIFTSLYYRSWALTCVQNPTARYYLRQTRRLLTFWAAVRREMET